MAPTLRKAFRAVKDSTKVGVTHVRSQYAELDVAILKATSHVVCPPKEKHVKNIILATTLVPMFDVVYCIQALSRRLAKTLNWTVATKTLIVLHRILRGGDRTVKEALIDVSRKGCILKLSNFKDDSSSTAWDCSAGVRTYALFLEERLECFRVLKYDVETERVPSSGQGKDKGYSRTRYLNSSELLEQLPALQQLLHRLIGCRPEGAAVENCVMQSAFALVLKESFSIYCAINDGIINLVDKFFKMLRHEAMKAIDIYERAGKQSGSLSDFYNVCKGLELTRHFQFPILREPPHSFLATMEEYIREAPRVIPVPLEESPTKHIQTSKNEEDASSSKGVQLPNDEKETSHSLNIFQVTNDDDDVPPTVTQPPACTDLVDLLGLNLDMPNTSATEDGGHDNLPLAITSNDVTLESHSDQTNGFDPFGWELSLETVGKQLATGLDTLTLDNLYKVGECRASLQPVREAQAENLFDLHEAFPSMNFTAPTTVPESVNPLLHEPSPFGPETPAYILVEQPLAMASSNPFGDAVGVTAFEPQTSDAFSLNPVHQQVNDPFNLNLVYQNVSSPTLTMFGR